MNVVSEDVAEGPNTPKTKVLHRCSVVIKVAPPTCKKWAITSDSAKASFAEVEEIDTQVRKAEEEVAQAEAVVAALKSDVARGQGGSKHALKRAVLEAAAKTKSYNAAKAALVAAHEKPSQYFLSRDAAVAQSFNAHLLQQQCVCGPQHH